MLDPILFFFFIIGLGIFAAVLIWRCLEQTLAERPHLTRLEQALAADPAGPLPDPARFGTGTLARTRLEDVSRLQAQEATVDAVALAEHTAGLVQRGLQVPRAIASVLVLLGLCGAIFGLFKVVSGMAGPLGELQKTLATTQMTPEQFQAGLKSLFTQMTSSMHDTRNAFMCSLSGIGGTVVLLIFMVYVSNAIETTLQQLEGLTLRHLLPRLSAGSQALHVRQVGEIFQQGSDTLALALESLRLQTGQVHEHIGDLQAFVHRLKQGTLHLDQVHERVGKSQEELLGMAREFVGMAQRIETAEGKSQEDLQRMVEALKTTQELTHQSLDESRQLRTQLAESLAKLEASQASGTEQTRTLADSLSQALTLLKQVLDAGQASSDRTAGALGKLAAQLQEERQQFDTLIDQARADRESGASLRQELGGLVRQLKQLEGLVTTAEHQRQSLDRLTEVLGTLATRESSGPDWHRMEQLVTVATHNWESELSQTGALLREFVTAQKTNGHATDGVAIAPVVEEKKDDVGPLVRQMNETLQRQERANRAIRSGMVACSVAVPTVVLGQWAMMAGAFPHAAAGIGGGIVLTTAILVWLVNR